MKEKILYIVPSANIGGAETFLIHTAKYHQSYEPIYCLLNPGPLHKILEENQKKVYLAPNRPRLSQPMSILKAISWLGEIAKEESVSYVFSNMDYAAVFGGLLSGWKKHKHIWYQHGPGGSITDLIAGALPHKTVYVNSDFTGDVQRKVEKPIAMLNKNREIHKLRLGVELETLVGIENEQDFLNKREKTRKEIYGETGLSEGTPIAAMLCRLQPWKGVHLFLDALSRVNKQRPLAGVIWGGSKSFNESENYQKDLQEKAVKENIPVFFAGPTNCALKKMSSIDIVVNASIKPEPFGLSTIEGMCSGAIPVVPAEGGSSEIIEESPFGFTFEPRNAQSLAEKLIQACKEKESGGVNREELISYSRATYSAKNSVENLEQHLSKVRD